VVALRRLARPASGKLSVGSKEAAEKAKILLKARLVLGRSVVLEKPPPSALFGR
jgi:hypothetical protein